jgi:RNA polymerase II subunit A small phosphatase-like protein
MFKPLLILDIDNTLIFSFEKDKNISIKIGGSYYNLKDLKEDFITINLYRTFKRPYLDKFISYIKENFELAVWTAAGEEYAKAILSNIGLTDLRFLYTGIHCTAYRYRMSDIVYIKNLNKIKRNKKANLERTLILDDNEKTAIKNYGNLLRIKPFFGDLNDKELLKAIKYLEKIKNEPNFRSIEKRGWSENIEI